MLRIQLKEVLEQKKMLRNGQGAIFLSIKLFTMNFGDFIKVYYVDMEPRIKEHTMRNKQYIIDLKVLPYFKNMRVSDNKAATIRKWQNELMR